jgi:hypothetical protein
MFKFLKMLFGGSKADASHLKPAWSFSDAESIGESYRQPDRVDYKLHLSTWRYHVAATFCNDAPYAESDTSCAQMEYEVRRSPTGQWEVRLLGRNGYLLDVPEEWEAVPSRFVNAWEKAWAENQRRDSQS